MKHLVLILSFFLTGLFVKAQEPRQPDPAKREQRIAALYVAFISKELQLTEDEAKRFWPVHTQFDSEMRAAHQTLSNDGELKRQQALLDIKKKYQDRFVSVLGAERTNTFFRSDAEFRKKLVERLKNMRQQNGKPRPMMERD